MNNSMNNSQEVFDQFYALKQAKMAFQEARTFRLSENDERTCIKQAYGFSLIGKEGNHCGDCHLCLEGKATRAIEKTEPFNQVNAQVDMLCTILAATIGFVHTIGMDLGKTHNKTRAQCTDQACKSVTHVLEIHEHA